MGSRETVKIVDLSRMSLKDAVNMTLKEQKRVANLFLRQVHILDTPLLITVARKILQVLESRGLGEDLSLGGKE